MTERKVTYSHNVEDGFSIGWYVEGKKLYVAASACNAKDQFSRKAARAVINNRLGKKTAFSTVVKLSGQFNPKEDNPAIRQVFFNSSFFRPRENAVEVMAAQIEGQLVLSAEQVFKAFKKELEAYFEIPAKERTFSSISEFYPVSKISQFVAGVKSAYTKHILKKAASSKS